MQHVFASTAQLAARRLALGAALVSGALIGGCSDSTSVGSGAGSQLGFTTGASASSASADVALAAAPITKNGHTLDLKQVTVVIDRAQLKRQVEHGCSGDDDDKNHTSFESCAPARIGPTMVDLPLDGSVTTVPANVLPAGTFREIELRITMARLVGTFDGQAFDVTLPINAHTEIEFTTPLVVTDSTPTSITINLPVQQWLTNSDGSLVDPRQLLTNDALLAQVKARIAASLHAFEDRDHDGKDDHVEHGGR